MSFLQDVMRRISPALKQRGFTKNSRIFRIIKNDVAYCVGFDAPSGILYTTVFLIPLYIPSDTVNYTYGNRMDVIQNIELPILTKDSDSKSFDQWFSAFVRSIDEIVMPFFEGVHTPQLLVRYIDNVPCTSDSFISCSNLHVLRLRLFTYLYVGEHSYVADIALEYLHLLKKTTYLTNDVIGSYVSELDRVNAVLQTANDATDYITETIQRTMRNCFPK